MNTADLELEIELCSNSSFSNDSEIEVYINTFNKYLPVCKSSRDYVDCSRSCLEAREKKREQNETYLELESN